MDLNPRDIVFLQYLLEETQYRPLHYYAQKMNVTVRTLRTNLKNLECYLKNLDVRLERKSGLGIYLNANAMKRAELHHFLSTGNKHGGCTTPNGRRLEILRMLLYDAVSHLSVQKLSEQYYVSPASIVNDLKYVEKWLNVHGLQLLRDSAGTRVKGDETQIRKAVASLIEENGFDNAVELQALDAQKIDRMTMESLLQLFAEQDIHFLEGLLNLLEKQNGYVIGEPYYLSLLMYLLIVVKRVSMGYRIEPGFLDVTMDSGYELAHGYAERIAEQIEMHFDIRLGEEEVCCIYRYLVSFGIGTNKNPETDDCRTGERLAEEIMFWTTEAMEADFGSDENLKNEFQIYMRSMINRIRYDIQIKNNLLSGIRQLYPELLAYLDGVLWCLGYSYGFPMVSQDEIAYICMYCQAAVAASRKRQKVLIVCQSGYGTSQLLMTRLVQAFPHLEIAGVTSVRTLREMNLSEYSFLISTVRLQALPIPHIVISPLLSEQDIEKIKATGLLMESGRDEDGRRKLEEWFLKGSLEITKEKEVWNHWLESFAEVKEEDKRHLFGGFLDVVLIWKDDLEKMYIFSEGAGQRRRAVIQGKHPEHILQQLAAYYKMEDLEYDFYGLDDYCQEHDFLCSVLPGNRIITGRNFKGKEEVIRSLADLLFVQGAISDVEAFCRDVFAREMEGTTAIEDEVAMPHGQAQSMSLAMAILPSPIPWGEYEGEVVWIRIVVLFAMNSRDAYSRDSDYFKSLSIISKAIDSSKKREELIHAKDGEMALELLTRSLRENKQEDR